MSAASGASDVTGSRPRLRAFIALQSRNELEPVKTIGDIEGIRASANTVAANVEEPT
jgi:hypothetical protein